MKFSTFFKIPGPAIALLYSTLLMASEDYSACYKVINETLADFEMGTDAQPAPNVTKVTHQEIGKALKNRIAFLQSNYLTKSAELANQLNITERQIDKEIAKINEGNSTPNAKKNQIQKVRETYQGNIQKIEQQINKQYNKYANAIQILQQKEALSMIDFVHSTRNIIPEYDERATSIKTIQNKTYTVTIYYKEKRPVAISKTQNGNKSHENFIIFNNCNINESYDIQLVQEGIQLIKKSVPQANGNSLATPTNQVLKTNKSKPVN